MIDIEPKNAFNSAGEKIGFWEEVHFSLTSFLWKGCYVRGKKEGVWKCFFMGAYISQEVNFKNDIRTGEGRVYHFTESQSLSSRGFYNEFGNKDGEWIYYSTSGRISSIDLHLHNDTVRISKDFDEKGHLDKETLIIM